MLCPHCKKQLPEKYSASWCPLCGKNLPSDPLPATDLLPGNGPVATRTPVTWWLFWSILLAPAVLAAIGAASNSENLAIISPLAGGAIAGIICGVMLANSLERPPETKILLGFVLVPLFALLSFALGFGGCVLAGSVPINLH